MLREYQKEALGRSDFYLSAPQASWQAGFSDFQKRKYPAQLFFHLRGVRATD